MLQGAGIFASFFREPSRDPSLCALDQNIGRCVKKDAGVWEVLDINHWTEEQVVALWAPDLLGGGLVRTAAVEEQVVAPWALDSRFGWKCKRWHVLQD